MKLGDKAKPVSVLLEGVKQLELVVTDGGNGPYYDHADWADAKFETEGAKLTTFNPISSVPYILTPKAAAAPKLIQQAFTESVLAHLFVQGCSNG